MSITRRNALALTGAGLTAALVVSTASAASSELETLIEAHRKAWDRFNAALDAENAFDRQDADRRDLSIRTSLGFDITVCADRDLSRTTSEFHHQIAGRYRGEMQRSMNMLKRAAPVIGMEANEALRKAQARDLRAMRQLIRDEHERREAIGYAACIREWQDACDAENDAMEALLLYRCRTPEELARKAAYAGEALKHCVWQEWQTDALLASMMTEGRA